MSTNIAYCEACDVLVSCHIQEPREETLIVRGKEVAALQKHAYCPHCGAEVTPNEIIDYNVTHAHDAYRKSIDAMTPGEIRALLEKYDIGAQPLSNLLGWGANTIDRQIRHTIPDREHTRRLRELNDPAAMQKLLEENKARIASSAYRKAKNAVDALLRQQINSSFVIHYKKHPPQWKLGKYELILAQGGI